jgi:hypothetical protein
MLTRICTRDAIWGAIDAASVPGKDQPKAARCGGLQASSCVTDTSSNDPRGAHHSGATGQTAFRKDASVKV